MKRWFSIAILLVLMLCSVSAQAYTATVKGKSDRVNLRSGPYAGSSNSMGLYFTGTQVRVLDDLDNGWSEVVIGTEQGYMMTKYLTTRSVTSLQPIGTVTGKTVNVRRGPGLNYSAIDSLSRGATVTILGETKSQWYYVEYDETNGYISADYLRMGATQRDGGSGSGSGSQSSMSYSALISQAAMRYGQYNIYALQDMNNDGIPELWLQNGTCEADYTWSVYSTSSRTGKNAYLLKTLSGGHTALFGSYDGSGDVYILEAHMGVEAVTQVSMVGHTLRTTLLFDQDVGDGDYWDNGCQLETCSVADLSLLRSSL